MDANESSSSSNKNEEILDPWKVHSDDSSLQSMLALVIDYESDNDINDFVTVSEGFLKDELSIDQQMEAYNVSKLKITTPVVGC